MGWSYRKSFGSGPFRVNFSKRGISYSLGVKGARVNIGPRGTYVNLSAHGISYRKKINDAGMPTPTPSPVYPLLADPAVQQIASADVMQLTDTDSRDFVAELSQKAGQLSYRTWLGIVPLIIFLLALLFTSFENRTVVTQPAVDSVYARVTSDVGVNVRSLPDAKSAILGSAVYGQEMPLLDLSTGQWLKVQSPVGDGYINSRFAERIKVKKDAESNEQLALANPYAPYLLAAGLIVFIPLIIRLKRADRRRFAMELHYDMDDQFRQVYERFSADFGEFSRSARVWQYLNAQQTADYKRNAGAGKLIKRIPVRQVSANQVPLAYFKTNVAIPCIHLNHLALYFLPERVLVKKGNTFAAVFYKNLRIDGHTTRFIEDESVPSDAKVVDHTWRYVNKRGGPDRRFNNNRQLPICAYSEYTLTSDTGIYEIISTSRQGAMDQFAEFIAAIGSLQSKMSLT